MNALLSVHPEMDGIRQGRASPPRDGRNSSALPGSSFSLSPVCLCFGFVGLALHVECCVHVIQANEMMIFLKILIESYSEICGRAVCGDARGRSVSCK